MLRTNLATRPFYNERSVHALLAAAGVLVVALTLFNVFEIVVLSRRQSALGRQVTASETRARELKARAVQVRQGLDTKKLEAISGAAQEANAIIEQRLFSWTELLNRLETTLPEEMRITSMRPRVESDGVITIQMTVAGRRVEDIARFFQNLERTGVFADMLMRDQVTNEEGMIQATLEGRYVPSAGSAPRGMR